MQKTTEKTKRDAVQAHIRDGRTISSPDTEHAEYGVSQATISNWVHAYREECQNSDSEMSQLQLMEKAKRLRQEKTELEKENAFLKKAAAFFAKETG